MRSCLIDFIVEAHAFFGLLPDTLFLAINLLDRYCSRRVVYKQYYQLAGCTALLIAAKYADKKENVPKTQELGHICCKIYNVSMFTQMEMHMLSTLEWRVGHPTADTFLRLMTIDSRDDEDVSHLASYISELTLYHRDFVSVKPSMIARSSVALARLVLRQPETDNVGWSQAEIQALFVFSRCLNTPASTLCRKYSTAHMSGVSQALADFLAKHANINTKIYPHVQTAKLLSKKCNIYNTLQKRQDSVPGHEANSTDSAKYGSENPLILVSYG